MLDLRIVAAGNALPLSDLPTLLGRQGAAREIADQIEALIALVDDLGGDSDLEQDDTDFEPTGDETDIAYPEWHTMQAHRRREPPKGSMAHEDDELDDFPEEDDPSGQLDEDGKNTGGVSRFAGPGCVISDPEEDDGGTYLRLRERRRRQRATAERERAA